MHLIYFVYCHIICFQRIRRWCTPLETLLPAWHLATASTISRLCSTVTISNHFFYFPKVLYKQSVCCSFISPHKGIYDTCLIINKNTDRFFSWNITKMISCLVSHKQMICLPLCSVRSWIQQIPRKRYNEREVPILHLSTSGLLPSPG